MNTCDHAISQIPSESMTKMLASLGFENVCMVRSGDTLKVVYENNLYRWNVRGWIVILDSIVNKVNPETEIHLITLSNTVPVFETFVKAADWKGIRNGAFTNRETDEKIRMTYLTRDDWNELKKLKKSNSNLFKFDFIIYPQIYIQNNYFDYIYEIQFNIAPAVEFSLWKGGMLTGQVIFPLYNNPHLDKEGDLIRPGFITVSQDFRLPGPLFGRVSLGKFDANRYGVNLGLTHPFRNPHWSVTMNAAFTGWTYFENGVLTFGRKMMATGNLTASYYYSRFNLQFDITAGRYLYGDYGARFDCVRYFGETAIGIWGMYSGGMRIGGFHFTVPFPPGKRSRNHHVRVLPPRYFEWEYRSVHVRAQGNYFETNPDENRSGSYFNLIYFKNSLHLN
jgi:hypothetical protein